jgi:hypothetical protein
MSEHIVKFHIEEQVHLVMNIERPILMSAPMVRAILDGRKTQTRRIVKPQLIAQKGSLVTKAAEIWQLFGWACPYGSHGDRIWVKETWRVASVCDNVPIEHIRGEKAYAGIRYIADNPTDLSGKTRPSIFMPRWASRITLEITEVRVQRLQDICKNDVIAEGTPGFELEKTSEDEARACYRELWKSINGKGSWEKNPWVWVLTFKRL